MKAEQRTESQAEICLPRPCVDDGDDGRAKVQASETSHASSSLSTLNTAVVCRRMQDMIAGPLNVSRCQV